MRYKINYFKASGKWYTEAEFELKDPPHMCEVGSFLRELEIAPGLQTNGWGFHWVIEPMGADDISYPMMILIRHKEDTNK